MSNKMATTGSVDEGIHKFVMRFNGERLDVFVDGEVRGGVDINNVSYDLESDLILGGWSGNTSYLNSELNRFCIYHFALSDRQIKSIGGQQYA